MKKNKIEKSVSIKLATNPGQLVLLGIVIFNVLLFFVSAIILMHLNIPGTEKMSFFESSFYAIRIIMTGDMDFVINEIGGAGAAACAVHVLVTVLGTVFFTGSLIAYLTNTIAAFMSINNPVGRTLHIYDHIVFLGWNVRAPEMMRSLLYTGQRYEVVVISSEDRTKIQNIINESIVDAIFTHNKRVKEDSKALPLAKRLAYRCKNKLRNRLVIIIRQGETYSSQQLKDIALSMARAIIVLGDDANASTAPAVSARNAAFGNSQILKTVMQVVDIASKEDSANDQNVIVEVDDDATMGLIWKVTHDKSAPGKCTVIPMPVTRTIGSLIAMFALTPSLGAIYNEIFTLGGLDIGVETAAADHSVDYVRRYLDTHVRNLPLSIERTEAGVFGFYAGEGPEKETVVPEAVAAAPIRTNGNLGGIVNDIILMGHNTKLDTIIAMMDQSLAGSGQTVRLLLADDNRHLGDVHPAHCEISEVYSTDAEDIEFFVAINKFIRKADRNVTVMLLSDDTLPAAKTDDETIANLIRLKEILYLMQEQGFGSDKVQIVVEIINPTHYDIIKNYGIKDIIISNRMTSKMISQIAFENSLFGLYRMMISKYGITDRDSGMEIFTQYAADLFVDGIPAGISAFDLVRSVFEGSIGDSGFIILMGIVDEQGDMHLFDQDRRDVVPQLTPKTQMICFRGHIN